MKKIYWNILKVILGITILLLLLYKVKIAEIYQILIGFDFSRFYFVMIALAFIFFFEVLNIKILISKINSISFIKLLKYHFLTWSIGLFIPGKIGQFSIIYLLKKEGMGIGESSAVILIDKLITLLSLSILALCGFAIFFSVRYVLVILAFLILLGLVLAFFILHSKGRHLIKKFILRKHSDKFKGFSKTLRFYLRNCKKRILLNFILTFVKWGASATMISFLFISLGYFVNFWTIYFITPMGVLVSFIPISLSGLGIRESTAVFLYSQIGVSAAAVAGVYIVNLIINYIVAVVSIALFLDAFGKKSKSK